MQRIDETLTAWLPELLYTGGRFERGLALVCDEAGRITHLTRDYQTLATRVVRLPQRALLPGLVNAHSHSFQRGIRGRTEHRANARDSFWTWREQKYQAMNAPTSYSDMLGSASRRIAYAPSRSTICARSAYMRAP